jgi:hypothetical protein
MDRDCRVDQIAAQRPQPSENSLFIRASKPGVADDVGYQDRREFAGLTHGTSAEAAGSAGRGGLGMVRFHAVLEDDVEAGSASPRVDRPVYPRRFLG